MKKESFLEKLPSNFRHEKSFLIQNNLNDFKKLSNLKDHELNNIQKSSPLCTLNNLRKIRAISIFRKELSISPHEAYLLLHSGISSVKSLSILNPYELKERIGKLERILMTKTETKLTLSIIKKWIKTANQICKSV